MYGEEHINITSKEQYLKQVAYLESITKKGEDNVSANEINDMHRIAIAVERYEDEQLLPSLPVI